MEGLFEVTLEANRGLRQQAVLDTILDVGPAAAAQPGGHPDRRRPRPLTSWPRRSPWPAAGSGWWRRAGGATSLSTTPTGACCEALAAVGNGALSNAELYQQVHFERERLSSITLNIGEGVCAIDAAGKLTFVNPAAADLIELPSLRHRDRRSGSRRLPRWRPDFLLAPAREAMRTGPDRPRGRRPLPRQERRPLPVAYTASAVISDGAPSGAVIAFRDITERKAFEDELHHHAFYDSLTGLANRRLLVEQLDQALRRSALDRKTHALIFVDVDRFKSINDSLGHVTGDEFLVAIADPHEGRGARRRPAGPLRRRRVRGAAGGRGRSGRGGRRGPADLRRGRAAHRAAGRPRDGGHRLASASP